MRINGDQTEPIQNSTFINSSTNYRLVCDIELQSSLIISSNTNTNIDLNGYVISFAPEYKDATVEGTIFYVKGTLNIYDSRAEDTTHYWTGEDVVDTDPDSSTDDDYEFTGGAITGGATSRITNNSNVGLVYGGGGIFILSSGQVNMYAGTIIGNETKTTNSYGGGVYVWNGGIFNMYGGEISYNDSAYLAGGVFVDGTFNMYNGVIKENTAVNKGGGIYADNTVNIYGGEISNNSAVYGGGMFVAGTVAMSGGSVTDNTALVGTGGGVYINDGTFSVSGATTITENTADRSTDTTTDITANNVNITNAGVTITIAGELTGEIGVTRQSGTGLVATYSDEYEDTVSDTTEESYLKKIVSDSASYYRLVNDDGTVELINVQPIDGTDYEITYDGELINIAAKDYFFDEEDILDGITDTDGDGDIDITDADITYSVTPTTGAGYFNTSTNQLDVSSAGEFEVSVYVAQTDSYPAKYGTATLIVEPVEITLTSISAIDRAFDESNHYVELNQSIYDEDNNLDGYLITGILSNDDVVLDFSDSYGYITGETTSDDDSYNDNLNDGESQYNITIHGLALTGADSGNYILASTAAVTSTVIINTAIPYIAWPAATDIIYGESQSASILSGGKVVVKLADDNDASTADTYVDITEYGSFKWNNPATNETVGSYAHAVSFVINDADTRASLVSSYTESVIAALEDQIHYVSYDVQAAAVSFTVSGNAIVKNTSSDEPTYEATCEVGNVYEVGTTVEGTLITAGYRIVYYYTNSDGEIVWIYDYDEIETDGSIQYYIGIEFINADESTNYNYHHSGSADSIAKQIAVLNIYEETAPSLYTSYFDKGTTDSISAYAGDIIVLPTISGDDYIGWKTGGVTYDFGSRFAQTATNVEFTAVAASNSEISGTVSGTDFDPSKEVLSGVSIFLMQGSELIASDVTDENGEYTLYAPDGRYTLVAMRDLGSVVNQESIYVAVSGDTVVQEIALPSIRQSISLNVDAGFTGITAAGLYGFIDTDEENTINVNVDQVNLYSTEYSAILEAAAENGLSTDNVKLFYDINATEQPTFESTIDNGDIISLEDFGDGFTFYIPIAGMYQNKDSYTVYRHDGSENDVEILTSTANANGEYIDVLSDGTLVIYAKKAAVYALAFENFPTYVTGNEVDSITYSSDAIQLDDLDIFDLSGYSEYSYTVTEVTGAGEFDEETNTLKVSSVGEFEISIVIPENSPSNARELIITSTLEVTPKTVTISAIGTNNRAFTSGSYTAQITIGTGLITGIVNDDDVDVDTLSATATITSESEQYRYDNFSYTSTDDNSDDTTDDDSDEIPTFAVSISGVNLSGADAGNYIIDSVADSTVTIDVNLAYFSWPTAANISYTESLSNGDLYGGKVVVKNSDGNLIEVVGSFVWDNASTTINQDAGTYTTSVHFQPDTTDSGYQDSYVTIQNTTQYITYTIDSVPVSFTISDNAITYTGNALYPTVVGYSSLDSTNALNTSEYNIIYMQYIDGAYAIIEKPTDVGMYLVCAEFTSTNYRHSGTIESTAKQIGSFYITASDETADQPGEYTVSFYDTDADITDDTVSPITTTTAKYQDILIMPTISGNYIGWETETGTYYEFGARLPYIFTYDINLFAVSAPTTVEISGTISGTDLGETSGTAGLDGIAVAIMQGGEIIEIATTDENGEYSFDVPAGRYTVVVVRDFDSLINKESVYVDATADDKTVNITLPNIRQSVSLNVDSGFTAITADGLDNLISSTEENTINVNVDPVDITGTEYSAILAEAATNGLSTNNVKLFFDINATEQTTGDAVSLDSFDSPLTFYIPLSGIYQNKDSYTVYRHDGSDGDVEILTSTPNANSEYIEVLNDGTLVIHTLEPAVYALAFKNFTTYITGNELDSITYSSDAIQLDDLDIFDLSGYSEYSYTVTPTTGAGEFDEETNTLKVSSVGEFEITIVIPENSPSNVRELIITSTLEVTPKTVSISAIGTNNRAFTSGNYTAQITSGTGVITGIINDDTVGIDTSSATATITSENQNTYDSFNYTSTSDNQTYAVSISGVKLTGADAGNYTISSVANSTVTIDVNLAYFSWPTSANISYTQSLSNSDLYGGKVVVKNSDGSLTEVVGSFVWDSATAIVDQDAGTYTAAVHFQPSTTDSGYPDSYATISNTTQYITYTIDSVPVSFTISDNAITYTGNALYPTVVATSSLNGKTATLKSSEYNIIYMQYIDGAYAIIEKPTEVGMYLVCAEFTSTNYRHSGTIESTAKQIGSFYITASANTADQPGEYTVSFNYADKTTALSSVTAKYQDILIMPTLNTDADNDGIADYIGWETETGTYYEFGARLPYNFTYDLDLFAVSAPTTVEISGTISGTDLGETSGTAGLDGIAVAIMQGGEIIEIATTDENGEYSFDVPAGRYTVVVVRDFDSLINKESVYVDATTEDQTVDITLADIHQSVSLNVDSGFTAITADGLDNLISTQST